MKMSITKQFTFEASHRLLDFPEDHPCARMHGHSYRTTVTLSGPVKGLGPKLGVILDFGELKEIWKRDLEPLLDHRHLNDTLNRRNPTAEIIAMWLLAAWQEHITDPRIKVEEVTVYETATGWATATSD
jgi:6-pyruvoyltetrahydropterin/6-carboxytetrahydropterin synthase